MADALTYTFQLAKHGLRAVRACLQWLVPLLAGATLLAGCVPTSPPEGITAVTPFDLQRYQGRWYEQARLDHSFERGLTDVSATYQLQPDGSVRVVNRGFDPAKSEWREAGRQSAVRWQPRYRLVEGVLLRSVLRRLSRGGARSGLSLGAGCRAGPQLLLGVDAGQATRTRAARGDPRACTCAGH